MIDTHTLYTRAASLAAHSSRPTANAKDVFEAYHSLSAVRPKVDSTATPSSSKMTEKIVGLQTMARRSKRARAKGQIPRKLAVALVIIADVRGNGLELHFVSPPPSPKPPAQLTLSDDDTGSEEDEWEEVAIAGVTDKKSKNKKRHGARANPSYLFPGAPRLPPEHSYRRKATVSDTDGSVRFYFCRQVEADPAQGPQNQTLSTTLLSFIKATAVERGDIPSELGLVDYRRAGESEPTASKKRRWNVRAAGDEDMN